MLFYNRIPENQDVEALIRSKVALYGG